jgi:hypothetical protein
MKDKINIPNVRPYYAPVEVRFTDALDRNSIGADNGKPIKVDKKLKYVYETERIKKDIRHSG